MARAKVSSTQGVRGGTGVKVFGVEELVAKLVKINLIARIEVGFLMKAAAEFIKTTAIELAPERTGNLKTSIETSQIGAYTHMVVADTTLGSDPGGEGKNAYEYAGYVEHGTSKMSARPFMAPAVAAAEPLIQAGMNRIAARITSL